MPHFSEEINGKMKMARKNECRDTSDQVSAQVVIIVNHNREEKEEDIRLPLTLGENYSALAAMT